MFWCRCRVKKALSSTYALKELLFKNHISALMAWDRAFDKDQVLIREDLEDFQVLDLNAVTTGTAWPCASP